VTDEERSVLEYLSNEWARIEARLYDHVSSTFRWLMATTFAANGGAVVALLNDQSRLPGEAYALRWFAVGIVLSIITGVLSTIMGMVAINPLQRARAKAAEGLLIGDMSEMEKALPGYIEEQRMKWWMWSPSATGLGSLVTLIVGLVILSAS
jgi:hypothetical protein